MDDAFHDGIARLRTAEAHDRAGREREAIVEYEAAIAAGLPEGELDGALHGLGSSFRAIGRFDDAERTLREAMRRFPNDASVAPFLAMTLYNLGRANEAVALLLRTLVATTTDTGIRGYARAIETYATDLDRRW